MPASAQKQKASRLPAGLYELARIPQRPHGKGGRRYSAA
jgi:hypothetical protein